MKRKKPLYCRHYDKFKYLFSIKINKYNISKYLFSFFLHNNDSRLIYEYLLFYFTKL